MDVHAKTLIPVEDQLLHCNIGLALLQVRTAPEVSCHHVALAVEHVFGKDVAKAQHGRFADIYEHSWLVTKNLNIIDVYPVAMIGGPVLLDGHRGPWPSLYRVTGENSRPDPKPIADLIVQLLNSRR